MVISDRTRILASTIKKLYHRGANSNIRRILSKSHAADVAAVLQTLKEDEAFGVFKLENTSEQRASILSYLDSDLQRGFVDRLSSEEATEVVESMEPDDAADLLGQLPDEDSKTIIENLLPENSSDVVGLMGYAPDSAGGIMSSDYLALPEATTVAEVIQALQSEESESKVAFYIYVVNRTGHLVGVVSLKQILLSRKTTQLRDVMTANTISVSTETDQEHVASLVAQYDFLSVPVVDKENILVGVITVDDVIDVIRQEAEEDLLQMGQAGWNLKMSWYEHLLARLPWLFLSFLAGAVCFLLIHRWPGGGGADDSPIWNLASILPLVLSLGMITGNQSATVILSFLQSGRTWGDRLSWHLLREAMIGLAAASTFGLVVFGLSKFFPISNKSSFFFAQTVALQMIAATLLGCFLPIICQKLKANALTITPPIYAALADISAVFILLYFFNAA